VKDEEGNQLYFRQLPIGPMQNYVYLIGDRKTREAVVVDAAWDIDAILNTAAADGMRITKALVTHFHPDHLGGDMMGAHITGAAELLEREKVKVIIHKEEAPYVKRIAGLAPSDMVPVESGDKVTVGSASLTVIHTPGHSPGSQCFLIRDRLISGDTLFVGGCGRVDLPGSNPEDMYHSLTQKLMALPDNTIVYPGHNYADRPTSSVGEERRTNMICRFGSLREFLRFMGY